MTKTKATAVPFEEALEQLEMHVRTLEGGELTLDQSIATFEEGMQLARACETKLAEAKGKVEVLLKQSDGTLTTTSLKDTDGSSALSA